MQSKFTLTKLLPYFVVLIFVVILYGVPGFSTYIFGDTAMYSLYLAGFAKNFATIFTYKNNFLLWNPYYLSIGLPTLSVVDYGVLYPANFLIAFIAWLSGDFMNTFPLYRFSLFAHLYISTIFVYKTLLKHLSMDVFPAVFGALLWIFIGFNTEFLSAGAIFLAGSYLPICFHLKLSKNFFLYYSALALSFLAGYPIVSIIIFIVCFFYELFFTPWSLIKKLITKELIGFAFITLPIIAPLYLSTLVNFAYSIRGSPISLEGFLSNAAALSNLYESFIPKNTPFNSTSSTNQVFLYFSLVGLIIFFQSQDKFLFLKDKRLKALFFLGIIGILLTIGKWGGISMILYYILPGFNFFRRLSVFSIIPSFVFCILVPFFLGNFNKPNRSKFTQTSLVYICLLTTGVLFSTFLIFFNSPMSGFTLGLYFSAAITILVFAIIFFVKNTSIAHSLLVLVLLLEAIFNVNSKVYLHSKIDPKAIFEPKMLTNKLQDLLKPMERVHLLDTEYNYTTSHLNIEQTAGYLSLASTYGVKIATALTNPDYDTSNLQQILGIKYIVKKNNHEIPGYAKVYSQNQSYNPTQFYNFNYTNLSWEPSFNQTQYSIFKSESVLPRLYLASDVKQTGQTEEVLFDIAKEANIKAVFIDELNQPKITPAADLQVLDYHPNYIRASVVSKGSTFVANTTGFYPGWWLKVNNKWSLPIQTNWFMMGTFVPEGNTVVEFFYFPYGLIAGGICIIIALFFWVTVKRKML